MCQNKNIDVCELSHTYLLGCLRYEEKHAKYIFKLAVGICCSLQICNSVVNMVVKRLVFGQSLMVVSTLFLCKSISRFFNVL